MDMKRILQAMDGVATKPVAGANDMARFLRVVKEAELNQIPPMPDVAGLQAGQSKDLGNGEKVTLNQDGTVSYQGGWGTYVYNGQGQHIKTQSPSFAGYSQETDATGAVTQQNYSQGPLALQKSAQGTTANYQLGDQNLTTQVNEGANPHKVALPVQMAMQHYQQPKEVVVKRPSLLKQYFAEAEEQAEELIAEQEAERKARLSMYAQKIANRVLMKESRTDEIAGAFPSPSTREKWAKDAAASNAAEAKRQAALKAQADAERLQKNTAIVDKEQRMNYHAMPDNEVPAKEDIGQRNTNRTWAQITDYEKRAKATSNDIKKQHYLKMADELRAKLPTNEGEVVKFPKKHKGDLENTHDCPKCGGDLQGGKYMGHQVKVCMPCKQVYLPPNSGIDHKGDKIVDEVAMRMQGSSQAEKDANARAKAREAEEKAKHLAIVKAYVDIMAAGQPLPPKMQQSYNTMPDFRKEVDAALANIPGQPGRVDLEQRRNYHLLPKNEGIFDSKPKVDFKVRAKELFAKGLTEQQVLQQLVKEGCPPNQAAVFVQGAQLEESPIDMTGDPNDPVVYGHQQANPMNLKSRIMQARAQLKELAELAESNELVVWEKITRLSKGGMFMGLEQNLEQIRHGISELAAKRSQGGVASRGIDKNIGEDNDPCWDNYKQIGMKKKGGRQVPNCVPKE